MNRQTCQSPGVRPLVSRPEEEPRIRELWELDTWPKKWSANDIDATIPLDAIKRRNDTGEMVVQPLLF